MMFLRRVLGCTALLLALSTPDVWGQELIDTMAADAPSTMQPDTGISTVSATGDQFQGLPRRAPEPRTLGEFWPVFAILSAIWLGIMLYVLRFGGRLQRITQSMQRAERGGGS